MAQSTGMHRTYAKQTRDNKYDTVYTTPVLQTQEYTLSLGSREGKQTVSDHKYDTNTTQVLQHRGTLHNLTPLKGSKQ